MTARVNGLLIAVLGVLLLGLAVVGFIVHRVWLVKVGLILGPACIVTAYAVVTCFEPKVGVRVPQVPKLRISGTPPRLPTGRTGRPQG